MKTILTGMLSALIFFGAVPTANASDMKMAGMEEELMAAAAAQDEGMGL